MAYTTIDNPELYFQTKLYTGNGSTQTITYDNTDADLNADMIWLKSRSDAYSHQLFDTVRGATKLLNPEATDAEQTLSGVTAFATDSFNIGSDAGTNGSSKTYVAWCWKKQAGVFDIVTYTGNGSNRTISHNLGAVPTMMVCKVRSTTNQWLVYHKSMGNTETMKWDDTSAATTQSNLWNSTTPTSSVFSVGTHTGSNLNGGTFVMYLFGDKQGVSKMGSYTGNGSVSDSSSAVDGTFVYTGFKPSFIMWKNSSNSGAHWIMVDNKRSPFNKTTAGQSNGEPHLGANRSNAEETTEAHVDLLSNGFKFRSSSNNNFNYTGQTYIYMAFAESPFVTSTGIPTTAR